MESLQAGEKIFGQGEAADCAYIIRAGSIELSRQDDTGKTTVTVLGEGELFGEDGLIAERTRQSTAIAITEAQLRRIDGSSFQQTVRDDPDAAVVLIKFLLERLRGEKRMRPRHVGRVAVLTASTPEAEIALGTREKRIPDFPCRIGRRSEDALRQNEIELNDQQPFQVSRSHLVLSEEGGKVVLYDRGSYLGTWIHNQHIGGPSGFDGPVIIGTEPVDLVLGQRESALRFTLRAFDTADQGSGRQ